MFNIIAKRYYIEHGHEIKENLLRQVVQDSFPPYVLTTIAEDDLVTSVKDAVNAVRLFVNHSCASWVINFSLTKRSDYKIMAIAKTARLSTYSNFLFTFY